MKNKLISFDEQGREGAVLIYCFKNDKDATDFWMSAHKQFTDYFGVPSIMTAMLMHPIMIKYDGTSETEDKLNVLFHKIYDKREEE
jgi:hypothetical protein